MPILPLQQFEADVEADRKLYEQLKAPTSIVVRFGLMKLVGEFPYSGDAKPGCGSKMVIRTHRGTELGEMLTSTCPNAGCSKSVTRKEMLEYIENSGGKDYPFFNQGRVLRVATIEDLNQQAQLDASRAKLVMEARQIVGEYALPMKVVDVEPILGAERLTYYFTSEDRVDFRDVVTRLSALHHTRIEMRQVGARDEARLTADYERCGQHCCCKQFLKVLKPVSMKSAKIQKATLDPLKISGRCGRLMCCLRYEDQTYDELRKRLPKKKTRVQTPSGWGIVIDSQILTQLVLVRLEDNDTDVAIPVEELGMGPGQVRAAQAPDDDDAEGDTETEGAEAAAAPAAAPAARPPRPPQDAGGRPPRDDRGGRPPRQGSGGPAGPGGPGGASGSSGGSGGGAQAPARPDGRRDGGRDGRGGGRDGGRDGPRDGGREGRQGQRPPQSGQPRPGQRPPQQRPPQAPQGQPNRPVDPMDQRGESPAGPQQPPSGPGDAEGQQGGGGDPQRRRRRRRRRGGGGPGGQGGEGGGGGGGGDSGPPGPA